MFVLCIMFFFECLCFFLFKNKQKWPAWKDGLWTNRDKLAERVNGANFKIVHEGKEKIKMNFNDFLIYSQQQTDETPFYVFDPGIQIMKMK